jgi:hypothetical protein
MDISKSSNFERYVCELLEREYDKVKDLWGRLERDGAFDLGGTIDFMRVADTGFVSGRSTHADRVATIRRVYQTTRP